MDAMLFYDVKLRDVTKDNGWVRLNLWSMQVIRKIMDMADLLDWETDLEEEDLPTEIPESGPERTAVLEKIDDLFSLQSPEPGKVPAAKFCTNDNWIVTKEESYFIAEGLEKFLSSRGNEWVMCDDDGNSLDPEAMEKVLSLVNVWIDYNKMASKYNGYRVE